VRKCEEEKQYNDNMENDEEFSFGLFLSSENFHRGLFTYSQSMRRISSFLAVIVY
jgi:hypothetical protein